VVSTCSRPESASTRCRIWLYRGAMASIVVGLAAPGCFPVATTVGGEPSPVDAAPTASADAGSDAAASARPDAPPRQPPIPPDVRIWLGTGAYDPAAAGRVDTYRVEDGELAGGPGLAAGSLPSWIVSARGGTIYYALDENNGRVRTFTVARGIGALREVGAVPSGGEGPVHMALDATGRWLLVAHYTSGDVSVLPVKDDGTLGDAPSDVESTGRNTHQVVIDPSNRNVLVPCVGDNHIAQLRFDPATGALSRNPVPVALAEAGAGPRHLALHPSNGHAYVVNERAATITAWRFDATSGQLTRGPSLATIPLTYGGDNFGAEVLVAPNGRFVYTSNRGHDSVSVFSVDDRGTLRYLDRTPSGGAVPRSMALTPRGDRLLVANQSSNLVVAFTVDPLAGTLADPLPIIETSSAVFFVGAFPATDL
jgi:6-phosphogluconolactonase